MSTVDVQRFVMSHVSLTPRDRDVDNDELPSVFFQAATQKKKQTKEGASVRITDRQSLERRRNSQTKENEQILGKLERMADDESFVESTLACLEYPISTNTTTAAKLLKDIIDTTAPYQPIPQWTSAWKLWRKKIIVPTLVWPKKRQISKYAPWMAVLIVYFSYRLAWYEPSSSVMTDTELITLRTYHDGRLRGGLSPSLQQQQLQQQPKQQLLPNNILSPPLDAVKRIDTLSSAEGKFLPVYSPPLDTVKGVDMLSSADAKFSPEYPPPLDTVKGADPLSSKEAKFSPDFAPPLDTFKGIDTLSASEAKFSPKFAPPLDTVKGIDTLSSTEAKYSPEYSPPLDSVKRIDLQSSTDAKFSPEYTPPLDTVKGIDKLSSKEATFTPKFEFEDEKPNDGHSMLLEKAEEERATRNAASQPRVPGSTSMNDVQKTSEKQSWISFEERVHKLKALSAKGHLSLASGSGPITQFLYQQQRNQDKLQEGGSLPQKERALENENPALLSQEARNEPLHEHATQKKTQETNPQLPSKEKDQESHSLERQAGSNWKARKPDANSAPSPGLITLNLV
jgi:hypothetical protein